MEKKTVDKDLIESEDELFNFSSFGVDIQFDQLCNMFDSAELIKPELQRKYVWSELEASRFIESLLYGLPVPSIFFAKQTDETRLIIDGYQRIMTVHDYIKGVFTDSKKKFALTNSKIINQRWRGKLFVQLDESLQRKIRFYPIHAIVFEQKRPANDNGMYLVFERINTGGKTLRPQEIRNCINSGSFNRLLLDLNKNTKWRMLWDKKNKFEDSRMLDVEMILRFFAFRELRNRKDIKAQIVLQNYLTDFMREKRNIPNDECIQYRNDFEKMIDCVYSVIGSDAFRALSKDGTKKGIRMQAAIFDSIAVVCDYALHNNSSVSFSREDYQRLLIDSDYQVFTSQRTTSMKSIYGRFKKASLILFGKTYEWTIDDQNK